MVTTPGATRRRPHRDTRKLCRIRSCGPEARRTIHSRHRTGNAESEDSYLLPENSLYLEFCKPAPVELLKERLSKHNYALLSAFLEGMLEGSGPGVEFIDGNENAYYYTNSDEYFVEYHGVTQMARYLVDPKLWPRLSGPGVRAGQSLYVDQYYGLRGEKVLGQLHAARRTGESGSNTIPTGPCTTADTYVWCYSEWE